ncbi:sensor histidine kinase [Methylobacterium sp. A54F]
MPRWRPPPGSLARRLLLGALAFVTVALLVAGLAIGLILHRFVRGQIDGRLDGQIVAIRSALEPGPRLRLDRDLDGPPFDRPFSGWYWQVQRGAERLGSRSLDGGALALPRLPDPDPDRPSPADGRGPRGEGLILRVLVLPAEAGAEPTRIAAAAPEAALRRPVREALVSLALALGVLGLCLVGGVLVQVRLGLRPLGRLRADLAAVRAGQRERVPAEQPAEIRPVVRELNLLLDQNAANLERARTHVANLAHGLKTPLATLSLALAEHDPDGRLGRLVGAMDRSVRHHLRRARAAALDGANRTRADLAAHVADLRATLERLHADKALAIEARVPAGLAVACDGQDLDEMLGNLLDNACQWARTRVSLTAEVADAVVRIAIADDGPGLGPDDLARLAQRGRRLDESVPGHGFGLAITTELAELYGGTLVLDRAPLGGLRAVLSLPA